MRLYIVRHADPDYENNTITPKGHLEAQALAERFKKEGLDKIYSSPMGRAIHTAEYTSKALNIDFTIQHWTHELEDATVEVKPWGRFMCIDIPGEVLLENEDNIIHNTWHHNSYLTEINMKEKYEDIVSYSDSFLKEHGYERIGKKYKCINPHSEKLAVFCHGGFGLTWVAHLLQIPPTLMWSGFWLPPSSVTTILFDERSKDWAVPRCIGLGDVSHLFHAGLDVQPRGIHGNFY
jgi:broad specificity phosphatase PhoE